MGKLDGRVALVTGAARGQGEAEARLLVAEGARVVLADVLDDVGAKVADDIGDAAAYEHLDVTSEADWQRAVAAVVERFGRLDILVNNAGILRVGTIVDAPLDEYMAVIQVNQVGCWLGMKTAAPAIQAAGGGAIVNTSSTAGLEGVAGMSAYVASKFAVRGMTKTAALELGRLGIRVNSVHPGGVDTAMIARPEFADVDSDAVYRALPVPRVGQPEEVAKLVLFLVSDDSSYCTGAEFVIDGGATAGQAYG